MAGTDRIGNRLYWRKGGGRSGTGGRFLLFLDDSEHVPNLKCVPDLESITHIIRRHSSF